MKRMLIIAMLTIAAAAFSACSTSQEKAASSAAANAAAPATPSGNVEQEIKRMEQEEWVQADLKKDIAWYERHWANEYIWTSGRLGKVNNKAQDLAEIKDLSEVIESESFEDFQVRTYGNVAVATYKFTTKGKEKGAPFTRIGRSTNVWVNRDGRWQVAASHSSPIPSTTK